ncbi:MAG: hypothetical protein R2681_07360 [Pyrinomonadaceae bacterium]
MDTNLIPSDFREFLKLLNKQNVRYILIGGYADNYYGYVRPSGDLDIWIPVELKNTEKLIEATEEFGFGGSNLDVETFLKKNSMVRMGVPPMRLEILNKISGVEFE